MVHFISTLKSSSLNTIILENVNCNPLPSPSFIFPILYTYNNNNNNNYYYYYYYYYHFYYFFVSSKTDLAFGIYSQEKPLVVIFMLICSFLPIKTHFPLFFPVSRTVCTVLFSLFNWIRIRNPQSSKNMSPAPLSDLGVEVSSFICTALVDRTFIHLYCPHSFEFIERGSWHANPLFFHLGVRNRFVCLYCVRRELYRLYFVCTTFALLHQTGEEAVSLCPRFLFKFRKQACSFILY